MQQLSTAEQNYEKFERSLRPLSTEQRESLDQLANNFHFLWNHPKANPRLKKRLIRQLIKEIIVDIDDQEGLVKMTIHWAGGAHTLCHATKRKRRPGGRTDPKLLDKIRILANEIDDTGIARILNMQRIVSARGLRWNKTRVGHFRATYRIQSHPRKSDPNILNFNESKEYLGISGNGILGLVDRGAINKNQLTEFAPWKVKKSELDSERVQLLVEYLKKHGRFPKKGGDPVSQRRFFT